MYTSKRNLKGKLKFYELGIWQPTAKTLWYKEHLPLGETPFQSFYNKNVQKLYTKSLNQEE